MTGSPKPRQRASLQVSEKTVERLATKGDCSPCYPQAARRPPTSPVYCPDDLERVKAAQTAQMIVMPPPGGRPR